MAMFNGFLYVYQRENISAGSSDVCSVSVPLIPKQTQASKSKQNIDQLPCKTFTLHLITQLIPPFLSIHHDPENFRIDIRITIRFRIINDPIPLKKGTIGTKTLGNPSESHHLQPFSTSTTVHRGDSETPRKKWPWTPRKGTVPPSAVRSFGAPEATPRRRPAGPWCSDSAIGDEFCGFVMTKSGWWWLEPWNFKWLSIREWNFIIPTDVHSIIFQRGRSTTNQKLYFHEKSCRKSWLNNVGDVSSWKIWRMRWLSTALKRLNE